MQRMVDPDTDMWYSGDIYWMLYDIVEGRDYSEPNILNTLMVEYLEDDGERIYVFAVPEQEGSEILGEAAKNPGSSGLSVFVWTAEDER